jgi:hypothetical protein
MTCAKRHALDERSVETWKRKRKMKAHERGRSNRDSSVGLLGQYVCGWGSW